MNENILKDNQITYIITILNHLDWNTLRIMFDFCSKFQPIDFDSDEGNKMIKVIDNFQEIESTITGVPIK